MPARVERRGPADGWRLGVVCAVRCCALALLLPLSLALGQGVITTVIRGTVRAPDGAPVDGARVSVVSQATGFRFDGDVRRGRFAAPGLDVGGPYTVTIRMLGYRPEVRTDIRVALGETPDLDIVLTSVARALDTMRVSASARYASGADGGTSTTIGDSVLHRLPTLNRDMFDFVRLVPQVSTRTGLRSGFSGGGVGLRYNNYLVNGVSERSPFFNATLAFSGGRSVPLGAVREYQVLLAPYDVRYGDFAGAMVNTITRSGTNRVEGSVFSYGRHEGLARRDGIVALPPHERWQYGLAIGGPIARDRVHFFVATELQRASSPAAGPYVGQETPTSVPVREVDLAVLDRVMRTYDLAAGSGGPVENRNPLAHGFARVDIALPAWSSRVAVWSNHSRTKNSVFSRVPRDSFALSTLQTRGEIAQHVTAAQFHTTFAGLAAHNEVLVSHSLTTVKTRSDVEQPIVRVTVPGRNGESLRLITGTHPSAQGGSTRTSLLQLNDNLTLHLGVRSQVTTGVSVEAFDVEPRGLAGSYGTWTFSSLDSLQAGVAERYELARDLGAASVDIRGLQFAAYLGHRWRATDRLDVTMGLRASLGVIGGRAPWNAEVDSIFGRRTDAGAPRVVDWSPRLGFTLDLGAAKASRLRGGMGLFSGRTPLQWTHATLAHDGWGIARLTCGSRSTDSGPPPPFVADPGRAPEACDGRAAFGTRGDVELTRRGAGLIRTLRGSLAWDHRLPWGTLASTELLVTRTLSEAMFVNLNLKPPQSTDRHGRALYGTIAASGVATPHRRSAFPAVIDLVPDNRTMAWQVAARLEKPFAHGISGTATYTYSRVRDVATVARTAVRGTVNWSSRAVSGAHEDTRTGISLNDIPHRVGLSGTWRVPWPRWTTELSFAWVGESGSPFTWTAGGGGALGDLNADGSNTNDAIYVPRRASDAAEIRFSGRSATPGADNSPGAQAGRVAAQQLALDRFIDRTPCLRRQRGRVMARNSCRDPWTNSTLAALRQSIPVSGRVVEAELQVLNVLNLLRRNWGQYRVASPSAAAPVASLLEHVEHTGGASVAAEPVFRFATPSWTTLPAESNYQLQLALRYRF